MTHDSQTRLEELLAHQQHEIDTLSGELARQRKEIDRLRLAVAAWESKFRELADLVHQSGASLPDEKPPHY